MSNRQEPRLNTRPEPDLQVPGGIVEIKTRAIKTHMICPNCGHKGTNDGSYKKATTLTKRYYKCSDCPRTWVVDFTPAQAREVGPDYT